MMNIKLSFLGAAQNVTGSRFMVEANGARILVDCGLYQERDFRERNWDDFPVPASNIDAVVLTHAHLDHCGWLPRLVHEGFGGKVYCTPATQEITKIVLVDSAHLQEEDASYKKKRHKKEGRQGPFPEEPLYTSDDAQACFPLFQSRRYEKPVEVARGIEACFHNVGHILGAASVTLKIQQDGESRTILFSGDVGRWDRPILRDPTLIDQADYVLVESTYGDRVHETRGEVKDKLCKVILDTKKAGGNIIVPSFAIERAQEILYHLNELLLDGCVPHLITFLDSPMAVSVTKVFQDHPHLFDEEMVERVNSHSSPFEFPGLTMVRRTDESKAINNISGTIMVIAGSGMCTGGRIKHHLFNNITRPECTVLFVGYQAVGTLGRTILEKAHDAKHSGKEQEVRILGQKLSIKAKIAKINGFSGHADRNELDRWLAGLKQPPKHVFVIHGEANSANHFADHLRDKNGWSVSVPAYKDTVELN
jgi:metallo-beta-lactamase family protein